MSNDPERDRFYTFCFILSLNFPVIKYIYVLIDTFIHTIVFPNGLLTCLPFNWDILMIAMFTAHAKEKF